ncbi:response regulator [Paenibacillus sp. SYP-B3998]|uniref:Response regulator n=1 Tax=Paenibacillus sp. SYP-B3998 TaxID=2678564 RepID=A0A6G3ZRF2_9BACL|nr:response regulator [Paenibacillus sp. SYP-B3998]NEW04712.1 response regulator [Paenibacillus sp. SYP-B3998]
MFNVVIVEDEKPILELMKVIIGRNPHCVIIGAFTNPLEALASLAELQPDIAFLDVEMPKMNGLELALKINEISEQTRIIFTTAHRNYALNAFEVYAFDYILKPVTPTAIERVTNRLIKLVNRTAVVEQQAQQPSIRCFGGFEVWNMEGALVRWPTRKTEELFAYFLCHPGQDINKWHLADILWPDMLEDRASHNLHNTIYRLKKIMKEQEIGMDIIKTNEGYMLDTSNAMYDLLEFQKSDLALGEGMQDTAKTEQVCSLYSGPLLERKDYLWKAKLEEGYYKQYTSLVRNLIQRDMDGKEWSKAEQKLDVYLSMYPLNEEMHQLLMDIYASSGKRERIAKHFARFEALYLRELGMEPSKEMRSKVAAYLE